jgi:hypothetical protein
MTDLIRPQTILPPQALEITPTEAAILRELASQVAELAARPCEAEKRALWQRHNALLPTRPLVFCDPELGWQEIIRPADLVSANPLARQCEFYLRQMIFYGTQMLDDRPIPAHLPVPHLHSEPDWGLRETRHGGEARTAYVWEAPVKSITDLERLHPPTIGVDFAGSQALAHRLREILGDLLEVRLHTPWWWSLGLSDTLARLRGLEQIMFDMLDQPELIHRLMEILRDGTLRLLDELEAKGLLAPNWDSTYVGSGGWGNVAELPGPDFNARVRTCDMWGFAESQETVGISHKMFAEFIFPYQLPILERFGLNCYGCCEPVDKRWPTIRQIPRLRRVSISPWSDRAKMAQLLEDRYVYSLKPRPSDMALEVFDADQIRQDLRQTMDLTRGCHLEVIMKDVTTLRDEPQRAVRWVQLAREAAERVG